MAVGEHRGVTLRSEQWLVEGPEPQRGNFGQNPLLHQLRANECNNKLCYFFLASKQWVAGTGGGRFWAFIFFRETARERSGSVEQVAAHAVAASAWVAVVVLVAGPCPCTRIMVAVVLAIATNTSTQVGRDGARGGGVGGGASRGPSNPEAHMGPPLPWEEPHGCARQQALPTGAPASQRNPQGTPAPLRGAP